jgi:hypothetical protein
MPLVCAKAPGKKTNPAIGSTGMGAAVDRRIPARWVSSGLGKGRDGTYVHLGLGSAEQWPVRGSAAPGLGGRGEPCSGEQVGRPDQCAGGQAQGGRGEGLEVLSRHGIGAGHRAH